MDIETMTRKIAHKVAQLHKAEERVAADNTTFNYNNYLTTKKALHILALELATLTNE